MVIFQANVCARTFLVCFRVAIQIYSSANYGYVAMQLRVLVGSIIIMRKVTVRQSSVLFA